MAAFVRRRLFRAMTSIRHAFGGVTIIRAQCHRCFAKQKNRTAFWGRAVVCIQLLLVTRHSLRTRPVADQHQTNIRAVHFTVSV
jgi:hypothetical protein